MSNLPTVDREELVARILRKARESGVISREVMLELVGIATTEIVRAECEERGEPFEEIDPLRCPYGEDDGEANS